jgi:hypothetical protein
VVSHPMFPPWANHGTSELLSKVWPKREGWCGPPMVGRPMITITPARAFCTGLEVVGFRFRRTLPNHVETEPSSQVAVGTWAGGVCPPSPTGRDVRDPRVTLRFGCNTTVRRVHPPARVAPRRIEYVSYVGMLTFKHTKVGVCVSYFVRANKSHMAVESVCWHKAEVGGSLAREAARFRVGFVCPTRATACTRLAEVGPRQGS